MMVDPQTFDQLNRIERFLDHQLPAYLAIGLRSGLFRSMVAWKKRFRSELDSKFKIGGRRVAGAFGAFTAGRKLEDVQMHAFTRWKAADIYEKGGTIVPGSGRQYMAVPVTPRAYTAAGRVRRSWRGEDGRFKPELFKDLKPIKTKRGILLVREVTGSVTKRGTTSLRRPGKRGGNAIEPIFLLIKRTHRKAVLDFYGSFERSGVNEEILNRQIATVLRRATASLS